MCGGKKALVEEKAGPEGECWTRNEVFDHKEEIAKFGGRVVARYLYMKKSGMYYI